MNDTDLDGPMSDDQISRVSAISADELSEFDAAIFSFTEGRFRKTAYIVGRMVTHPISVKYQVPDVFISQRIQSIVASGKLESVGDLRRMRFSEVRRPSIFKPKRQRRERRHQK